MSLTCLYTKDLSIRVVEDEEVDEMLKSGMWFKHPNDVKQKELKDEKPIRQQSRKRCSDSKHSSKET